MKFPKVIINPALILLITTLCVNTLYAQQSKTVPVKPFNSVSVASGIDMYLTQGSTEAVVIKGHADLVKDIIVTQSGTSISIKFKEGVKWGGNYKDQNIKAYLSYKTLSALVASGGSDIFTQNTLKTTSLSVTASGGSDLELSLACKNLSLSVSGGSDAELEGSAENMVLTASGGSDIDASGFQVSYAKVNVSGGSDAEVNVSKALEASATGGSDINYKGNAVLKKTSSSKSGDIKHVN